MNSFIKKVVLLSGFILVALCCQAFICSDTTLVSSPLALQTNTGTIAGTLLTPAQFRKIPVVLIIAGSGPTDRDGNNPMMKNNSLKMLAMELGRNGIATLRYDKRGIGESKAAAKSEADLRFNDYVNDAKDWIQLLKQDKRFSKVIVIGHSEGSLIGMIAAGNADKFISIAGAGQSADKILKEQLSAQPQGVQDIAFPILDSLANGHLVNKVNPMLNSIFRPSVQPYMISWFRYDPQVEIKKLSIPVLILQGTNDIQVSTADAERLSAANPAAKLVLLEGMNHILKNVPGDRQANIATYGNPTLPLADILITITRDFILKK
ncbi:MAG: alpha/beta fold hydrolase [Cytophagales bacterium]|nr:alpha/beta fold hydrolase [Cytophagales bacterium]